MKYEITVTELHEDGTRKEFKSPHELIGSAFVVVALEEYQKSGHEGVHSIVNIHNCSLQMIATALSGNKYLSAAAQLATMNKSFSKLFAEDASVDSAELFPEGEDAAK